MKLPRPSRKTGILLKTFPKISETFILNEILALEAGGFDLEIFSLQRPQENINQSGTNTIKAPVHYISCEGIKGLIHMIGTHLSLLKQSPGRYFKTLRFLLGRPAEKGSRFQQFAQAVCMSSILKQSTVAHLHVHFANEPAGVAELVNHMTGIPFSLSTHAKDIYLSSPESLRRKMSRSKFVVTCTEHNRHYLSSLVADDTSIVKIYHGLPIDKFRQLDKKQNGASSYPSPRILSVGRYRKKKGFPTLIQACRELKDEGVNFQCTIVGFGPEQKSLEQLIETLQVGDRVHLIGKMVHADLISLYQEADLFVLPCQVDEDGDRDGIPNVIMEAMAMQIPVISTTVSGIPELVDHGKTGALVPPKDSLALKEAMKELIYNPRLRQKLGAAGRLKITEFFNADHHIKHLKNLLSNAIGEVSAKSVIVGENISEHAI